MKKFNELTKSGKSRRVCIMLNKKRDTTLELMYEKYTDTKDESILDSIADYYKNNFNDLYHAYVVCDNKYSSVHIGGSNNG